MSLLTQFIKTIEAKNRSKNTLKTLYQSLSKAELFLEKPLEAATIEDLTSWIEQLKKQGLNTNSLNMRENKLLQFYNFCFDETDDPQYIKLLKRLKNLRVEKEKAYLNPSDLQTPEDTKRLINVATLERDKCIVASFFESGMRIGEMRAIAYDEVVMDEQKQEVIFNIPNMEGCKTGARSVVCVEIYGYVQDWMKCNPSNKFMPLSESGIRRVIADLFRKAGIKKPHNVHMSRHSAITHWVNIGMQPNAISMRAWGIPNSNMLATYIHLSEQMKASAYKNAKGMGEEPGRVIINPLSVRCVQCGRLIQTGDLCPQCAEIKQLKTKMAIMEQFFLNDPKIALTTI